MKVTVDSEQVRRTFSAYPAQSVRVLHRLIESSAIDVQRKMREEAPVGATGDLRRSIKYRMDRVNLGAEIWPDISYAPYVESGTRPHWTSIKEGTSLRKWAKHKGFDEAGMRNLQLSIAAKGTKANPFVKPTFDTMKPRVERDIISGFGRFVERVNQGNI